MAVRNKIFIPNEIYFITFAILGWKHIFINDKYCNLIYKWFDYMKEKYNNKIHGYVIMPNHIHCLIKITDKSPKLSILIMNAKRFLAYQIVQLLEEDIQANRRSPLPRDCGEAKTGLLSPPRHSLPKGTVADKQPERHSSLQGNCGEAGNLLNYFKSRARVKDGAKHKLFEDRYDSLIIQSRKFFLEKLNYIHRNPCAGKWRLAEDPENYKYSSASNYILETGAYDVDMMDF